jgi:hypothetical protein
LQAPSKTASIPKFLIFNGRFSIEPIFQKGENLLDPLFKLGVPILLLGGSVRFPLSQILRIEQAAVAQYENRHTEYPPQLAKAKRGKRGPYKVRVHGRAIDAGAIAK